MRPALCLIALCTLSAVLVSTAAQAQYRTLARYASTGGPPQLSAADLAPFFDDERAQEALAELNEEQGAAALAYFGPWLESHSGDSRAPLVNLVLGYANYVEDEDAAAIPYLIRCAGELSVLADYCLYWAASAAEEVGRWDDAARWASAVGSDAVFGPRSQYLYARVQSALGRPERAAQGLEEFLRAYPEAWYRADVEMDLADALVQLERFDEAARVYARIELLNPDSDDETRARERRRDIMRRVSDEVREELRSTSDRDLLRRAEILFDRHRSEQVIDLLEPVLERAARGSQLWCDASYLVGKSYSKLRRHSESVAPYQAIVASCDDDETRLRAYYNLGRGLWNVDRNEEAIATFEALVEDYPEHSYADDAMLYVARIHLDNGDDEQAVATLERQIERYPQGDMLKDAVWMQMSRLLEAGNHRGVVNFADQVSATTGENDIYSRGRIRYFRARSLEALSRHEEALSAYRQLITDVPMSWYAMLSFNRLQELDVQRAHALLGELRSAGVHERDDVLVLDPPEMAADPSLTRGRILLRLGLVELATPEFESIRSRYGSSPNIDRVVAELLDRSGAWHISFRTGARRVSDPSGYPRAENVEDWELAYPRPFEETVQRFAEERGLDPWLIYAVMREESGFQPRIESWANARGLMQLMIGTANDMARLTGRGSVSSRQLFEPEINIELGSMFLRRLGERFQSHPACMIAGYNGGAGNVNNWLREDGGLPVDRWVEAIPYAQTRHYVKRVAMSWWIYHWLYDTSSPLVEMPMAMPPVSD